MKIDKEFFDAEGNVDLVVKAILTYNKYSKEFGSRVLIMINDNQSIEANKRFEEDLEEIGNTENLIVATDGFIVSYNKKNNYNKFKKMIDREIDNYWEDYITEFLEKIE